MTRAEPHRLLRADARRNRDQIVAAARALFVTQGVEIPMEEIARHAGVGKGTLYRRFPDRDLLVRAVFLDIYQRLAGKALQARSAGGDPWTVLSGFLRDWAEFRFGLVSSSLCERMPEVLAADPELRTARAEWQSLFERMVHEAHAAGTLRADVDSADIATLMDRLVRPSSGAFTPDPLPAKLLTLILDGLRPSRQ